MTLYDVFVPPVRKMLGNTLAWLDKAQAHADAKGFEFEVLAQARLAPDQYMLLRQIQSLCDAAKMPPARLLELEPPKHPDTETSLAQLRPRIAEVSEYLGTFRPEQFVDAERRKVSLAFLQGRWLTGTEYVCGMALPNFYFHVTTAYSILRHNGVPLGKTDFIGSLDLRPLEGT